MRKFGRHSILFNSAAILFAVFFLAGAGTLAATVRATDQREHQAATERLNQLLDTVENTLSIACFVRDGQLAEEVSQGLLKNREVRAVTILADAVDQSRTLLAGPGPNHSRSSLRLVRSIRSPFDATTVIGQIEIDADTQAIEQEIHGEVRFVSLQIAVQLALIAIAVAAVMLVFIVRPIKAMSDGLHRMDATRGDRLAAPGSHGKSEIGRLVQDINGLADDLATTLAEERALRLAKEVEERKYRSIFENAETGIFLIDAEGVLRSWNPAFAQLMGIPANESFQGGLNLRQLPWENPSRLAEMVLANRAGHSGQEDELALGLRNGGRRWLHLVLNPVGGDMLQGMVHDVTGHREAEDSARRLAVTDPLTGLPNRLGLEERLHDLLGNPNDGQSGGFALILADLDNFRRINEGFGLPIGDAVIRDAANRLGRSVKSSDTVARLSGDRFALVLPGAVVPADLGRIAERILEAIGKPFQAGDAPIQAFASQGITVAPRDGTDTPTLLRNAELALDRAKVAGGNGYVFFESALTEAAEQRRQLENDLRQSLRDGDFLFYYQPIVDLAENRLAGAEALIRWLRPGNGLVPPSDFIPVAEETGLIDEIGLWAMETACAQLSRWQHAGLDRYLSVNISGHQIPDGLPPAILAETIRRHGIDPDRLALEITEGILLADVDKALAWLEAVRALGCRIYLDDFGTGYSSLSYLKRFPVDTLKVDKSFVRDMDVDGSDLALVEAVVAMAGSLGMQVIAEGVETADQLMLLRGMRCHLGQGYYFSRPVPEAQFEAAASRIAAELLDRRP